MLALKYTYCKFLQLKQILIGKTKTTIARKQEPEKQEEIYDDAFYAKFTTKEKIRNSEIIFPLIEQYIEIKSVADVGCGVGAWSKYFFDKGVYTKGYDFDWVPEKYMAVPKNQYFIACDLNEPIKSTEKFDLVLNIEVAEHLEKERAHSFVEDLTKLGDVIVFSAAIPYQGGDGHINEQFPEYWAKIFDTYGYSPVDIIRPAIWKNNQIAQTWVKQNMLVYVKNNKLNKFPAKYHAHKNILTRLFFLRFLGLKRMFN